MIKQDLLKIKEIDKMINSNLSETELNENIEKIKNNLLTTEMYIDYNIIECIKDKMNFSFSKDEVKQLVHNNQELMIRHLVAKGIDIDFGNGKYTPEDLKAISKIGWRYYAKIVPDIEELLSWVIKTRYLDKYDVQFCNKMKFKINWNKILLKVIESKRTRAHSYFFKAILKSKLVTKDADLTKLAIFNYESKTVIELCKLGWFPKLDDQEIKLWLNKTEGNIVNSISILEIMIKYRIVPVEELLNKISYLDYNIKWLKNPLQAAIWKFLKKLNIKTRVYDLTITIKYIKLNHKSVNESLFNYLVFLLGKDNNTEWVVLFKFSAYNGNSNFMDLISDNISNYYETLELHPEIYAFCKTCSIETLKKFVNYQEEIKSELKKISEEQKIADMDGTDIYGNIDNNIESLKHQLRELKKIKKMKEDIKKKTY